MDSHITQTDAAADDPLILGRTARHRGDHEEALAQFEKASRAAPRDLPSAVEVATTLGHLKRFEDSEAAFKAVLKRAPRNVPAMAGLADLLLRHGDAATALSWYEQAAVLEPRNVVRDFRIAKALQLLERFDEAVARLQRVLERNPDHVGVLILLGEIAKGRNDLPAAADLFTRALANDPSRIPAQLLLAATLRELGDPASAAACYQAVLHTQPSHVGSLIGLAEIARQGGDFPTAFLRLQAAAEAAPPGLALRNMIADNLRDLDRHEEAEAAYREILVSMPEHTRAVVGLGILETRRKNHAAALELFSDAAARTPENPDLWFRVVECLFRLSRFEDVGIILERLEGVPGVDKTELQVRHFDLLCATMQLEQAELLMTSWGGAEKIPDSALVKAVQLLAARKRWADVLAVMQARVIGGNYTGPIEFLMEPLARAARATGCYAQAYAMLARLPEAESSRTIRNTCDQILEEVALIAEIDPTRLDAPLADQQPITDPFRVHRSALLARVLKGRTLDLHIYSCTDAAYLAGAVVCFYTLLKHNAKSADISRLSIFCSDDVIALATELFAALAAAFSVVIDVRPASLLVSPDTDLRVGWGNFTSGRGLSQAAYYRIYAAQKLAAEGTGGRALYIDSDTCVASGIDQFSMFNMSGYPLAARVDDGNKYSIQRAARLLGIDQNRYFNSGVLLFDLQHPDLPGLLDRSIEISLTQQHRLTHVDQCALNLAFQGAFAELPPRLNWFVSPEMLETDHSVQPVITHFIAHPKPWDTMYQTANCMPWLNAFSGLGRVVPSPLLKQLLALHYPASPRPL